MKIQLTTFSKRHFDSKFGGTKILDMSPEEYVSKLSEVLLFINYKTLNGYAPFCKLLIVPNFSECKTGTMPITLENYTYMRSGYSSRTNNELGVLSDWFEIPSKFIPRAKFLVNVLYTREQLLSEYNENPPEADENGIVPAFELDEDTDYGVVAILAQMTDEEEPMKPITMMRNALGKEEGGSGKSRNEIRESVIKELEKRDLTIQFGQRLSNEDLVDIFLGCLDSGINREAYVKSVEFWSNNSTIKSI